MPVDGSESLDLDLSDPFPLAPEASLGAAQAHAERVDAWLDLRVGDVEAELARRDAGRTARAQGQEIWLDRGPRTFLTPYSELREIVEALRPASGETIVDAGAGYGRLGFVLDRHAPGVAFLGLELVPERVREGARALAARRCMNARLIEFDLLEDPDRIQSASTYFIYDFGTTQAIERCLVALREVSASRAIRVVGRGRAIRDAIERQHPWLSQVVAPVHGPRWSIYSSAH